MKIIQILNSPNWSAAPAYCVNLSYQLMKLGHDVLIMTEPGRPMEKAIKLGIPCDDQLRLNSNSITEYVRNIRHLKRVFINFQPDIVSPHQNKCAWLPAFVAKMCLPKAAVVRVRTDIAPPNKNPFNLLVNHKWTEHIVCGSELHKEVCRKNLYLPLEKLSVVYGSVDSDLFKPNVTDYYDFRKEIGVSDKDFLVCLLGRLSPIKGHEYALKTIASLKGLTRKIKLLCLGYEAERSFAWLKTEAQRLGIGDSCIPMGFREDLPAVLSSIDLGIITSLGSEANSRATLEYMACGKPVVATKVGVIPELILEGKTGYLVDPGNAEAMAERIKSLVLDSDLCEQMGKASRKRVEENFSLNSFGLQMEAIYKKCLKA